MVDVPDGGNEHDQQGGEGEVPEDRAKRDGEQQLVRHDIAPALEDPGDPGDARRLGCLEARQGRGEGQCAKGRACGGGIDQRRGNPRHDQADNQRDSEAAERARCLDGRISPGQPRRRDGFRQDRQGAEGEQHGAEPGQRDARPEPDDVTGPDAKPGAGEARERDQRGGDGKAAQLPPVHQHAEGDRAQQMRHGLAGDEKTDQLGRGVEGQRGDKRDRDEGDLVAKMRAVGGTGKAVDDGHETLQSVSPGDTQRNGFGISDCCAGSLSVTGRLPAADNRLPLARFPGARETLFLKF